jgi:hypothetical protein
MITKNAVLSEKKWRVLWIVQFLTTLYRKICVSGARKGYPTSTVDVLCNMYIWGYLKKYLSPSSQCQNYRRAKLVIEQPKIHNRTGSKSTRNRDLEENESTAFYRTFVFLIPFYNWGNPRISCYAWDAHSSRDVILWELWRGHVGISSIPSFLIGSSIGENWWFIHIYTWLHIYNV